jgi:hypothetical protein
MFSFEQASPLALTSFRGLGRSKLQLFYQKYINGFSFVIFFIIGSSKPWIWIWIRIWISIWIWIWIRNDLDPDLH